LKVFFFKLDTVFLPFLSVVEYVVTSKVCKAGFGDGCLEVISRTVPKGVCGLHFLS
jgi:hypothetical protein